ncbi:MAG: hypothetical protein LC633_00025, partial [Desulfobulbaceae bacterium]|nr:hypothetical protein [Desulfobulbaceae bacterium]
GEFRESRLRQPTERSEIVGKDVKNLHDLSMENSTRKDYSFAGLIWVTARPGNFERFLRKTSICLISPHLGQKEMTPLFFPTLFLKRT